MPRWKIYPSPAPKKCNIKCANAQGTSLSASGTKTRGVAREAGSSKRGAFRAIQHRKNRFRLKLRSAWLMPYLSQAEHASISQCDKNTHVVFKGTTRWPNYRGQIVHRHAMKKETRVPFNAAKKKSAIIITKLKVWLMFEEKVAEIKKKTH